MQLYNTPKRKKEPFTPLKDGEVKLYVCGPTVYDDSHIGHARCYVVFDILARHLKSKGLKVTYIRNFTDLDDKIIERAAQKGIDYLELAETYIKAFHRDMDALGLMRPDEEPRATEHIEYMISDIKELIEKGYAYQGGSDVYYDVARFSDYGCLSGRDIEDMQAGARVEINTDKRNPLDFVLWKESKPGEPSWESPWGPGRPGWHMECSAMSGHYLGPEFDIHGGGSDLIFPHHENEIAQAVPLGRNFSKYWMHNGFVQVNHQKMSKSLKNFFTIKEVLVKFHPEVLRLFVLSKHYRSPIDFSDQALSDIATSLDRVYRTLKKVRAIVGDTESDPTGPDTEKLTTLFAEAMDDDLNTARALGYVFEALRELNRLIDDSRGAEADIERIKNFYLAIRKMGAVLGVMTSDPAKFLDDKTAKQLSASTLSAEAIEEMIKARTTARTEKNWAEADRIRDELKDLNVILEDVGGETRWRITN